MKPIPETEIAYIAGLFDGDGCVGLYTRNKTVSNSLELSASIGGTNPFPLIKCKDYFGGFIHIQGQRSTKKGYKYKTFWNWKVCARKAEYFLGQILNYLIIKKQEVEIALESRKLVDPRSNFGKSINVEMQKTNMANKMKELKKQEWATLPM
jgi:hypothetical protein